MGERLTATCPACKDVALLAERITTCQRCETIYHEACWRRNGNRCSDPACEAEVEARRGDSEASPPVELAERRPVGPRTGLPIRVQSGALTEEGLRLQTGAGERTVAFSSIQMLGVGIIELDLTVDMPKSAMRAMIRKLMGDEGQPNQQRRSIRETYLLDIYVHDLDSPLRIDSSVVNYKSLLGEASYQSMRNFLKLVAKIARAHPDIRLDSSAVALLAGRRYEVRRYSSVYEFEMESHINRTRIEEQTRSAEIEVREDPVVEAEEAPSSPEGA